jgi:hypothetical protein
VTVVVGRLIGCADEGGLCCCQKSEHTLAGWLYLRSLTSYLRRTMVAHGGFWVAMHVRVYTGGQNAPDQFFDPPAR